MKRLEQEEAVSQERLKDKRPSDHLFYLRDVAVASLNLRQRGVFAAASCSESRNWSLADS